MNGPTTNDVRSFFWTANSREQVIAIGSDFIREATFKAISVEVPASKQNASPAIFPGAYSCSFVVPIAFQRCSDRF